MTAIDLLLIIPYLFVGWVLTILSLAIGPLSPPNEYPVPRTEIITRIIYWPVIAVIFSYRIMCLFCSWVQHCSQTTFRRRRSLTLTAVNKLTPKELK